MNDTPDGDPGTLRFLRILVTTLTVVMIVGFLVLIGFLVTRFPSAASFDLPASITLPDGTTPVAFTQTEHWFAVISQADEILVYDRDTGALLETIIITHGN